MFFEIFVYKVIIMEIVEIINSRIDLKKNLLEVSFRTIEDSEDEMREDKIDYSLVTEYGYIIESESFDFFIYEEDEDDEDYYDDGEIFIDESELISFLNEYYTVNPENIPRSELF